MPLEHLRTTDFCAFFLQSVICIGHNNWVQVTMLRRVLRLWMDERPPIWRVPANILNKQSRTADKG